MSKLAIVMSGEGARGAFQSGVLYNLYKQGIRPDILYGSSSGALNASGYAYLGPKELVAFWSQINKFSDVFKFSFLKLLFGNGPFVYSKKAQKLIEAVKNNQPLCEVIISKFNFVTGEIQRVSNKNNLVFEMDLEEAVTIPGIVHAKTPWVDGAVTEMAPLKAAIQAGADRIIVVTGKKLDHPQYLPSMPVFSCLEYLMRFVDSSMFEIYKRDLAKAQAKNRDDKYKTIQVKIISPGQVFSSPLDFTQCKEILQLGLSHRTLIKEFL